MKKRILKIASVVMLVLLLITISAVGTFFLIRNKNVEETGNVFGISWYNEDDLEFTITTQEQLYEFARLSDYYTFKNQTVKLGADIVVNEGNASDWEKDGPKKRWTPIRNFAGRFDGQGHTISGIYGKSNGSKMALFVDTDYNCTIKNVKLVNSYFETSGGRGVASFVSNGGGKLSKLYSDAIFSHKGEYCGGIASKVTNQTSFDECQFDGKIELTQANTGGIVDMISGGRVTMNHCLFSGQIVQDYDFARAKTGGLVGCIMKKATIILTDSLACGSITTTTDEAVGALFGITDSGVNFTITNSYVSRDSHEILVGIQGGNYTGNALSIHGKDLEGVKAYQRTLLNFTRYWAVTEDSTPVLRCFAETVPSLEGVAKDYDTDWYVKGEYNFEITTSEQLYGLMLLSASNDFTDVVFKLGDDIVMNEGKAEKWGKEAPELSWYGIRNFNGTFDGQGHTVSGLYLNEVEQLRGFFTSVLTQGDVQNFQLKNSYFESTTEKYAMMGSVVGDLRGRLKNVYSDAIVVAHGDQFGGIVGRVYDNDNSGNADDVVEVTNCWFDGRVYGARNGVKHIGGVVGYLTAGDLNISHCLNTGTVESETDDRGVHLGGIFGAARGEGILNISDCLNTGDIVVKRDTCVGSVIGRGWDETVTINISNTYATYESYLRGIGDNSASTVNGGVVILPENMLTGNNAYKYSTLDFPGYWAIVKEDTPILQSFAGSDPSTAGIKRLVDTSWYKADAKTYVIDSVEDLYGFMAVSAGTNFEGKTVKLGADIQVNAVDAATFAAWADGSAVAENLWAPISSRYNGFAGTFDGQGHTISGLYLSSWLDYSGFFSSVFSTGVVKNFSIKDSYFCSTNEQHDMIGSVVGDLRGKMENVYSNATVVAYGNQVGGLVGRAYDKDKDGDAKDEVEVTNSWFDGNVYVARDGARGAGGIVGWLTDGDLNISHCLNTGRIESKTKVSGVGVGGIFGTARGDGTLNVLDCLNTGEIVVERDTCVGAVIGQGWDKTVTINIADSYASYESYHRGMGDNSASKVIGGVALLPEEMLTGYHAYKYSTLDFPGYWAVVETDTPILQNFAGSDPSTAGVKRIIDTTWYKPDAETYTIDTVEELYGFMALSTGIDFKGKTVKLGKDIHVNAVDAATLAKWKDGSAVAENLWAPISTAYVGFAGTFDGQGNEITGLYLSTDRQFTGFISSVFPTGVVKNLSIKDSYFCNTNETNTMFGSVVGDLRGTLKNVYSSAYVETHGNQAGGLVGRTYDKDSNNNENDAVEVVGCWFGGEVYVAKDGARGAGGIVGWLTAGDLNISYCLNSGQIESETKVSGVGVGGIFGTARGSGTLNILDCLNTGKIVVQRDTCVGAVVGQGWDKAVTINVVNAYATSESHTRGIGDNTESKVKGNVISMPEQYYLGTAGYQWTSLEFGKDKWAARAGKVPAPEAFVKEALKCDKDIVRADISWFETKPYVIDSEADFCGLAVLVQNGNTFKGETIYLKTDIKMNDVNLLDGKKTVTAWMNGTETPENIWMPIGYDASQNAKVFEGRFTGLDGDKIHSISGIYVDGNSRSQGLFGRVGSSAQIDNLILENSYIYNSNGRTGSVVGWMEGKLENVYATSSVIVKGEGAKASPVGSAVGGLVGFAYAKDTTYGPKNCWFAGDVYATGRFAGGFIGWAYAANLTLSDCLFTGNVYSTYASASSTGGVIGHISGSSNITLKNCVSNGFVQVTHADGAGSVLGMIELSSGKAVANVTLQNVYTNDNCDGDSGATNGCGTGSIANAKTFVGLPTTLSESEMKDDKAYIYTQLLLRGSSEDKEQNAAWVTSANGPELVTFSKVTPSTLAGQRNDTSWYYNNWTKVTGAKTYIINDAASMYGFSRLVNDKQLTFEGDTIYLGASFNMNNGWIPTIDATSGKANNVTGITAWEPIGAQNATRFKGIFDGNGYTISGLYVRSSSDKGTGLFGCIDGTAAKIQSLRLIDSYVESTNASHKRVGSVVGWAVNGIVQNVYSNASVYSEATTIGGLVGLIGGNVTINSSWYDGDIITKEKAYEIGGLVGNAYSGTTVIDTCLYTGNLDATYKNAVNENTNLGLHIGGLCGKDNVTTFTVRDSICAGTLKFTFDNTKNVSVNLTNIGTICGSHKENISVTNTYDMIQAKYKQIDVSDSWIDITFSGGHANKSGATLEVDTAFKGNVSAAYGEAAVTQLTKLRFSRETGDTTSFIWKWREGALPIPEGLSRSVAADMSWYDASAIEFQLVDAADMYGLSKLVAAGNTFEGKTVFLTADLVMNPMDATTLQSWIDGTAVPENFWTPIGTQNGTHFKGVFDGQGHTISGIYVSSNTNRGTGLFGCVSGSDAVIKNLRLADSYIESTNSSNNRIGSIVGWAAGGTLQNVYSNATLYSKAATVGGLIGLAAGDITINSSWYDGDIITTEKAYEIGGLVGNAYSGTTVIDTCLYTGELDATYTNAVNENANLNLHIGGLCGKDNAGTLTVTNSICAGKLDFTFDNTKNVSVNLLSLGTICGSHKANTSVTNTYDMIQARYKAIDVSNNWNKITLPGGVAQVSGSTLEVDASFKSDISAVYGDAAVSKLTKLKFTRDAGDTTSLIWKWRTNALPIPEGLSSFCN